MSCPTCGKTRPCACDAAEWRADKAASAFAAVLGERIPLATDGRLLGGNLERSDRGDPQDRLRRLDANRQERRELEIQREMIALRAAAIRATLTELDGLDRDAKILQLLLAGVELHEIARSFGVVSHSWVSKHLDRIRAEATSRTDRPALPITPCACGCGRPVLPRAEGRGRHRRYATQKCGAPHRVRRMRAKRVKQKRIKSVTSIGEAT